MDSTAAQVPVGGQEPNPWSRTSPEGPWDYVVIGSGMGGMCAAAMLSRMGRKVLVLERHTIPGGFTHTFRRKHWRWDVGVHVVGDELHRYATGRLFRRLTQNKVTWAPIGPPYDTFHFPDLSMGFPDSRKEFVDMVVAQFPQERRAIQRYMRLLDRVNIAMKGWWIGRLLPEWLANVVATPARRQLLRTTENVVDSMFQNPRLKAVMTAQWGYYGLPPAYTSFGVHATVVRHFLNGGYYPEGGAASFARALLQTVADGGGWTLVGTEVECVEVKGGRARGVRLQDGTVLEARRGVISAAGGRVTAEQLLAPEDRPKAWFDSVTDLEPSPAHYCLYLGFKGDIEGAGAKASNQWFFNSWDTDVGVWDVHDGQHLKDGTPVLYASFPSLKDPHHDPGPEGYHTGELVTLLPHPASTEHWELWQDTRWRRRPQDYEDLKARIEESMLSHLYRYLPKLKEHLLFTELSTPLSTKHFNPVTGGAIYGLGIRPERFRDNVLRPKTPIPGLYLAGSDVALGGIMGAYIGGVLGAIATEPARALAFIAGRN